MSVKGSNERYQDSLRRAFHDGILLGVYLGAAIVWAIVLVWTLPSIAMKVPIP